MSRVNMVDAGNGQKVQAFPLQSGRVNLTTGLVAGIARAFCVANGTIDVIWQGASAVTITMTAGMEFSILNADSVEVASGTFHLA